MFHLIIILFSPFPFLVVKFELLRFAFLFPPPVLTIRTTRIPGASLVAQRLKHLPPMQETWVWFLSQEDPLEKEMATHSSILAWRIPWTEELGRPQSMVAKSRTRLSDFTSLHQNSESDFAGEKVSARRKKVSLFSYSCWKANTIQYYKAALAKVIVK